MEKCCDNYFDVISVKISVATKPCFENLLDRSSAFLILYHQNFVAVLPFWHSAIASDNVSHSKRWMYIEKEKENKYIVLLLNALIVGRQYIPRRFQAQQSKTKENPKIFICRKRARLVGYYFLILVLICCYIIQENNQNL